MNITPLPYYLLSWRDDRNANGTGSVTNLVSGEVYGGLLGNDSDCALRKKAVKLFTTFSFVIVGRIVCRIGCLALGTWAQEAYRMETEQWHVKRWEYASTNRAAEAPGKPALVIGIAVRSFFYLTRDITKLVTLPVAWVLMELSSFYGILRPLDGRAFVGYVEHAWSLNLEGIRSNNLLGALNYLAPCMQPHSVIKERNFFAAMPTFHPGTVRSQLLDAEKQTRRYSHFLKGTDSRAALKLCREVVSQSLGPDLLEVRKGKLAEDKNIETYRSLIEELKQKDPKQETDSQIIEMLKFIPEYERDNAQAAKAVKLRKPLQAVRENLSSLIQIQEKMVVACIQQATPWEDTVLEGPRKNLRNALTELEICCSSL
jgi:hypothetical protein